MTAIQAAPPQERHFRALELDKVLALCATLAICDETKARIPALRPGETFRDASRLMDQTTAAHSLSNRFGNPGISAVAPCREQVARARVGAMLSMRELLNIAGLLRCARILITWRRQAENEVTALDPFFEALTSNQSLEEDIKDAILSEDEIADNASPALSDIRRKIRIANQKARENLERITRSSTYSKYLQEQIVTIRNGRFVVPVRSEYRQEIPGLVHDTSSSGATLFVEPMSVVEQNNQIRELEGAQQDEINRILQAFTDRVAQNGDLLLSDYGIIIDLDEVFAKSRLADKMRAGVPVLVEEGETILKKARHPLIDSGKIVPIDIRIGGDFDTLVITGPNTGGKTVALKTLGLFTLMALCGLMLPCADGSTVCFYEKVLADIGDEQSIEQSLSTFSGHMTNIVSILEQADSEALVLIDELGAGTDPVEGAALAVAILSRLRRQGAKIAATTHYAEIKMYALQTEGVENASCEFDVATLRPTYRLLIGTPGRSNAFAISERLGLPHDVIETAQRQVSAEDQQFEDVVSSLEQARQELEKEKDTAQRLRREAAAAKREATDKRRKIDEEREKILLQAREQARSMVAQVKFQSDELMTELEKLRKEKSKEMSLAGVRGELRGKMDQLDSMANPIVEKSKSNYKLPRPLKRGDVVFLNDFGTEGTVTSPPDSKGYLRVQAGILETKVKVGSVRLVDQSDKKATLNGGSVRSKGVVASAKENASSEVDLRGLESGEAILELRQYLDNAALSGYKTVTIIHGKGTGALRSAVHQYLRGNKAVDSFRLGTYGEGEAGVTIAELK
ncbi:MAG: endonuclease MutS2 [Oscillospiraceae bacterium]